MLFSRGFADVTVVLTSCAFLWRSACQGNWSWCRQRWVLLSAILVAYLLLISAPLGYKPWESVIYSLTYLRWPLFAAALGCWLLNSRNALAVFSMAVLATLLFVVFDTFWQFVFGQDIFGVEKYDPVRLTGPMRNPIVGNLSLRLFFIGFFALAIWRQMKEPGLKLALMTVWLVLFVLFVYVTGERMSFLLVLVASCILSVGFFCEFPRYRNWLIAWICAIPACIMLFSLIHTDVFERIVMATLASIKNFSDDPYGRVFTTGFDVWKSHPFTGIGLANYADYCDVFLRTEEFNSCQRHPHNIYLHWLAETGVVGTLLFVASITALAWQALAPVVHHKNWLLGSCILATLFVSFWPIASSASFFNNWFGAIIWCGLGWVLAISVCFGSVNHSDINGRVTCPC